MDELAIEKEELDRRKKSLSKRKPTDRVTGRKPKDGRSAAEKSEASSSQGPNSEADSSMAPPASVSNPGFSLTLAATSTGNGPSNWSTDFIQPEVKTLKELMKELLDEEKIIN